MAGDDSNDLSVISRVEDFDLQTGTFLEKLVFNNRSIVVAFCVLVTLVLGFYAIKIDVKAGFEKMLPKKHPYVINYNENKDNLKGLGNNLRIVVESKAGDIYNKDFLTVFEAINDEMFFIEGVSRSGVKSIWTANTRWKIVTEEGFSGGTVMPGNYDGSPETIEQMRINIGRAGVLGDLVANNGKSAAIVLPLLDRNVKTGEPLNYYQLSKSIDQIRDRFEQVIVENFDPATLENINITTDVDLSSADDGGLKVGVTGFAKMIGELIDGIKAVMFFFAIAVFIAILLLYLYTRCLRSTLVVIGCTLVAVIWQLGILTLLGYPLDPFSILVPFLVFAIGVSHGAQKLNGVLQDMGRGTHKYVAARYTFRRLFLAGVTALISDGVGFAVLMIIQIQVIQDLAITASIGVTVLIFTNLILTPVVLSYLGVGKTALKRASIPVKSMEEMHGLWRFLLHFTERKWAIRAIACSVVLAVIGIYTAQDLQIGDLDAGAPELRADARYNLDMAYNTANYSVSSDIFAVIVKTEPDKCSLYSNLSLANELEARFRELEGVEDVRGLNVKTRVILAGLNEGFPKWRSLFPNQDTINYAINELINLGYVDTDCSIWPMQVYLSDHKAATLTGVVNTLTEFNQEYQVEGIEFLGAAGTAGFEAATNIVVKKANTEMLLYVYGAVLVLCFLTFRSVPGVVCAVLPLMLTSILCEALMVWLGMGVKVATLPVIALGVGIGVDYALYVLTVILAKEKAGMPLKQAYYETLNFTGRVVALIGVTLAAGVITWVFSPLKFQADMGILLTFMFIWNMFGALMLMPALAYFLLKPKKEHSDGEAATVGN
jgi:predicted RND superfamily exporter protein